jgi:hypothetical protein
MSQKPLSVKQMSKNYINYMMMFLNKKINLLIIKFKIYIKLIMLAEKPLILLLILMVQLGDIRPQVMLYEI